MANATSDLFEATNGVVQGQIHKEKLIVAAMAVATSTAHMLIVCEVKTDSVSENNRKLQVPYI